MSLTCLGREPNGVDTRCEKSFTYGTSGLTTMMSFAPAWAAMSTFVVETMPPSTSSRSRTRTGLKTHGSEVDVAKRRRHLLVDDAHHLLGRDPVGHQRGDERPGRGPDVDVELVDGAVDAQEVERPQRTDLVDAAREAAAPEHEGGLGPLPSALGRVSRPVPTARLQFDDVSHVD